MSTTTTTEKIKENKTTEPLNIGMTTFKNNKSNKSVTQVKLNKSAVKKRIDLSQYQADIQSVVVSLKEIEEIAMDINTKVVTERGTLVKSIIENDLFDLYPQCNEKTDIYAELWMKLSATGMFCKKRVTRVFHNGISYFIGPLFNSFIQNLDGQRFDGKKMSPTRLVEQVAKYFLDSDVLRPIFVKICQSVIVENDSILKNLKVYAKTWVEFSLNTVLSVDLNDSDDLKNLIVTMLELDENESSKGAQVKVLLYGKIYDNIRNNIKNLKVFKKIFSTLTGDYASEFKIFCNLKTVSRTNVGKKELFKWE
jgi:hypothetical protein